VSNKISAHDKKCEEEEKAEAQKEADAQMVEDTKAKFFADLEKSDDLNEHLQDLADFLQTHTGATGV
jgi:hypothetical protein